MTKVALNLIDGLGRLERNQWALLVSVVIVVTVVSISVWISLAPTDVDVTLCGLGVRCMGGDRSQGLLPGTFKVCQQCQQAQGSGVSGSGCQFPANGDYPLPIGLCGEGIPHYVMLAQTKSASTAIFVVHR